MVEVVSIEELVKDMEKVSDKPVIYSIKKPSKDKIKLALRALTEGLVRQVVLYYLREYKAIHIYRDRKEGFKLIDTSEKKPNPILVNPNEIDVESLNEPYELLVFT